MSESVKTICRICGTYCPIELEIQDGRPVRVIGDRSYPLYGGYTCVKGRALPKYYLEARTGMPPHVGPTSSDSEPSVDVGHSETDSQSRLPESERSRRDGHRAGNADRDSLSSRRGDRGRPRRRCAQARCSIDHPRLRSHAGRGGRSDGLGTNVNRLLRVDEDFDSISGSPLMGAVPVRVSPMNRPA